MTVEHDALRLSRCGQPILPVVTKDRVVREYHFSSLVVDFRIVLNPVEAAAVKDTLFEVVVVVPSNEIEFSLQLTHDFVGLLGLSHGEVAENEDFVLRRHGLIPDGNHMRVHFFEGGKAPAVHLAV